jgi:hypothetical protein
LAPAEAPISTQPVIAVSDFELSALGRWISPKQTKKESNMRKIIALTVAAVFGTLSAVFAVAFGQSDSTDDARIVRSPGAQELVVRGDAAVNIVTQGNIRASSNAGPRGFLLLMEYQGNDYTCPVTPGGQVRACNLLYWQR